MQLDRIKKNAKDYCHEYYENDLTLEGTYSKPVSVWGVIYVDGNLHIGGRIAGQGMIVCKGNVYITEAEYESIIAGWTDYVAAKGIPVVLATRVYSGRVAPVYSYEGSANSMKASKIILAGELSGQKARLKLMLALSLTNDHKELQKIFQP